VWKRSVNTRAANTARGAMRVTFDDTGEERLVGVGLIWVEVIRRLLV
jgi:hypothetical protein